MYCLLSLHFECNVCHFFQTFRKISEGEEDPMLVSKSPTWIVLLRPSRHRHQERRDIPLQVPSEALGKEG